MATVIITGATSGIVNLGPAAADTPYPGNHVYGAAGLGAFAFDRDSRLRQLSTDLG